MSAPAAINRSLSPLPDILITTALSFAHFLAIFIPAAPAWADSRAKIIPSVPAKYRTASRASSSEAVVKKHGLDLSRPLVLALQHPVTTQVKEAAGQMRETLEAIVEMRYPTMLIYPNSDAGGRSMIDEIKRHENHAFINTFKSLPRIEYLSLMKVASVMMGNSSSALIDAPSFGLPTVNIGIRQEGRERGKNVIDVGHKKLDIINAVKRVLADEVFLADVKRCENPYGDGKAGPRIADLLSNLRITPQLLQKKIDY